MCSVYLLPELVHSEHVSPKQQEYFRFWVQFRNVFGNVVEVRLVQNYTGCRDLSLIIRDLKTLKEWWKRDNKFAIQ